MGEQRWGRRRLIIRVDHRDLEERLKDDSSTSWHEYSIFSKHIASDLEKMRFIKHSEESVSEGDEGV